MKILITGCHGVIGSYLSKNLPNITTLSHQDCDLTDWGSVKNVKWEGEVIIHCAVDTVFKENKPNTIENDIKMIVNLRRRWPDCKLIGFGSGAMYDHTKPIIKAKPYDVPKYSSDFYCLTKLLTVDLFDVSLIIYGLEGPENRFIKSVIEKPDNFVINQDLLYSWTNIKDLSKFVKWSIKKGHGRYNICTYDMSLTDMAIKYGATNIKYKEEGMGNEYTGEHFKI